MTEPLPLPPRPPKPPVAEENWFRRCPQGGTVYQKAQHTEGTQPVEWFIRERVQLFLGPEDPQEKP